MPSAAAEPPTQSERSSPGASGLVQRVIAGSVLAAFIVAAILILPSFYFALLMVGFVSVGAWEWAGMAGWPAPSRRLAYLAGFMPLLLAAGLLAQIEAGLIALLLAGLAWWLIALAWVVRVQQGCAIDALDSPSVRVAAGWLTLVPAWAAVVALHGSSDAGPLALLYLIGIISSADTGAYFAGRRLGKRRLASNVSPGKSVEGVIGGLAAVAALAIVVAVLAEVPSPIAFVVLSLATALISILGDLTESVFKRRAGLKDSGSIIPGHGGILDRIDSLTAAAPLFVLGSLAIGGVF